MFYELLKNHKGSPKADMGVGKEGFRTIQTQMLSKKEADDLQSENTRLYLVGFIHYRDKNGQQTHEFCRWLQPPARLAGAGAGGIGGLLANGLKELVGRFDGAGQRDVAESWVNSGKNRECTAESLRRALGPEMITDLQSQTGLSESEIITRLCRDLPDAVDKYTPDGRLPATV